MPTLVHPSPTRLRARRAPSRPARPLAARRDLWTYIAGNALFWALWAAISVSADHWYWWAAVPLAGWTVVLAFHLARSRELG